MKYKTLAQVREAYKKQEITAPMIVDNDTCFIYQGDEKVWQSNPEKLLLDSLELLGIPAEPV